MNNHSFEKTKQKQRSVANNFSRNTNQSFPSSFVDNRPEALAQRKLQHAANNSPQVQTLQGYQQIANEYTQSQTQPLHVHENVYQAETQVKPSGGGVYYTANGQFLGAERGQLTGTIYITTASVYRQSLDQEFCVKNPKGLQSHSATIPIQKANALTYEAQSNIYTHILGQMEGVDLSRIHNGRISIYSGRSYKKKGVRIYTGYNNPARADRHAHSKIGNKMKITTKDGSYRSDLYTVESIQNFLGVHEYMGHGIKGDSGLSKKGGTHFKAYWRQYNHSSFQYLPEDQQDEIKDRIKEFMAVENKELYDRYDRMSGGNTDIFLRYVTSWMATQK